MSAGLIEQLKQVEDFSPHSAPTTVTPQRN